ncbi:DUF262 domain-containing protein [Nocardia sputi]|uniref:DUF262 domain-containing protein n=1 Tax=Nocardia sputi TaxID=2943705 RepID=UPI0020BF22E7|nr:DUF262 domain-containing protein [Nocardia sputi]
MSDSGNEAASSSSATKSRNENYKIQELVSLVKSGEIRVPEFQRSFRWNGNDVLALFDSILRGYPFGSLLLWKRPAPAAKLVIGAIRVDAPETSAALWVVDGQQRIVSLVNSVDPEASRSDERFGIAYSLEKHRFVPSKESERDLAIPLPDLFDLSRAFGWLQENPDAAQFAGEIQRVTALLRDVGVSASVIEQADEEVLRDVFDRINSAGKRLRGSEIFDAIHSATSITSGDTLSTAAIADRLDQSTDFGRLDEDIVYQAILVRRHPDITRDGHSEFTSDRLSGTPFNAETRDQAYERTEIALEAVIRFLQDRVGVPHFTFVPFRFHLLVLARYFALYHDPGARNLELLSRWVWRSTAAASILGYTGSTGNVRLLAGLVGFDGASASVKRLLDATRPESLVPTPELNEFRTNHSSGKIILAALWAKHPINPVTHDPLSHSELASFLVGESSPAAVALEILPRRRLGASNAANRVITTVDRESLLSHAGDEKVLASLLLDDQMIAYIDNGRYAEFLERRATVLRSHLRNFLSERTGYGFETTPPLSDFDFDDDTSDEIGGDS